MRSVFLNVHPLGSKPLEHLRTNTVVLGGCCALVEAGFYLLIPGWRSPASFFRVFSFAAILLLVWGLYEFAFLENPGTRWGRYLRHAMHGYYTPCLVVLRALIFWLLWLLVYQLLREQGLPRTFWFRASYHIGIPVLLLRKLLGNLFNDSPRRTTQFVVETVRLISVFTTLSLLMSFMNATFFPPASAAKGVNPMFILAWTPAVLAAITAFFMYFDALLGTSERRKHG